jgi:sugar lactone lactonase YvrE
MDAAGRLYVVEEEAGQISAVDATGAVTPILSGLQSPEGIALSEDTDALYVVEDVEDGRLVARDIDGTVTALAQGLEAPEGVAWTPGGTLFVTESNLQFSSMLEQRTRIAAISSGGELTHVRTDTPILDGVQFKAWSYAGIDTGPDGRLYVTNELAGYEITRTVAVIPGVITATLTLSTGESLFAIDPATGERELLASGLTGPEGLRFSHGGDFPLYVVEEGAGWGNGQLSVVGRDGRHAVLCSGFRGLEDVVVDAQGRLYVSEDASGASDGRIVLIEQELAAPAAVAIDGPGEALLGREVTLSAAVRPLSATLPITYTWDATGQSPHQEMGALSATRVYSWRTAGPQWITVTAANAAGRVTGTHVLQIPESPRALFDVSPRAGIRPLTVALTNRSIGEYETSLWDLGDGLTSTLESLTHTYPVPGSYRVSLTIDGPAGSDTQTMVEPVYVFWGLYLPLVLDPL